MGLLFPPRCAVCDDVIPLNTKYICRECRKKLVYIREPYCLKCGKAIGDGELCADCMKRKHYFKQGQSVFDYGCISDSLFRFKNKGRAEYADFYANEIFRTKKDYIRLISPDALVPVPIHKRKMLKRGYNQAEEIALKLSKLTGIPVNSSLILRKTETAALKELNLAERQKNLKNAFKLGQNDVKLKTIIIIDDIYTTGSTIDEMSRVIKEAFPCDIYFLTVTIGRG